MNAERTNHWIAIAANIGVIASVVFLALEIQQNTQTNRAQAVQEYHRDMRDSLLYADERMADIIHRAYSCEPLSITEQNVRRLYWERLIRTYENQWYQRQQDLIDHETHIVSGIHGQQNRLMTSVCVGPSQNTKNISTFHTASAGSGPSDFRELALSEGPLSVRADVQNYDFNCQKSGP